MTDESPEAQVIPIESARDRQAEAIRNAELLESKLADFASMNLEERETFLPFLQRDIHQLATPEAMEYRLVEYLEEEKEEFEEAVQSALSSKWVVVGEEEPIEPWRGSHTVVMLDFSGRIIAARRNTEGPVYEPDNYGDNLYPYALSKAVQALHIALEMNGDKWKARGLLDEGNNLEYIDRLLNDGAMEGDRIPVFLGEAVLSSDEEELVVGVSGAELREDYIRGMIPESMRDHISIDFLAGFADMQLAQLILEHIDGEGMGETRDEPTFFAQLRRAH